MVIRSDKVHKTFVIAEAGINHMGDLETAKLLVEAAKECDCDAVKFQSYITETRVNPGSEIYDILKSCELDYGQQTELKAHADKIGIEFFSTPFDENMLFFLIERLGLRRIKLASFDVTNKRMLLAVNEYAKVLSALDVILSTGMADYRDIEIARECLPNTKLTLMHCVSSYPTPEERVNLEAIKTLQRINGFDGVGYSDHTNDILAPALSVIAGARVVEKHFTLDLNNGAVDNPVSADPSMMKQMVEVIRLHERMMGDGLLNMQDIEEQALMFRRHS
jgi:sialic acid synthase SpsE